MKSESSQNLWSFSSCNQTVVFVLQPFQDSTVSVQRSLSLWEAEHSRPLPLSQSSVFRIYSLIPFQMSGRSRTHPWRDLKFDPRVSVLRAVPACFSPFWNTLPSVYLLPLIFEKPTHLFKETFLPHSPELGRSFVSSLGAQVPTHIGVLRCVSVE